VFKLTPTASGPWTESVLYNFTGTSDGAEPDAGLIAGASGGALYSTTHGGGSGYGTVFELRVPAFFIGTPGKANCPGQSVSSLSQTYGGMAGAATALGYPSVQALQDAIKSYCGD
jgi:hypothetical protein